MRKYLLGTITGLSMVVGLAYAITTQTFQNPVPVANGGLGTTTAISGLVWGNGTVYTATSTTGSGPVVFQTSPTLVTPILGVASGTALTLSGNLWVSGTSALATSTVTGTLGVSQGNIAVTEAVLATSTSMTVNWKVANQQLIRIGTSATTITFTNATATPGASFKLIVCNPPTGTAGAITWGNPIYWPSATAPTQTTTANNCDVWSFISTSATGTAIIFGNQSAKF